MTHKLALIGFGVVGQGLAKILLEKKESLKSNEGFEASIVAISDVQKGSLYHSKGLNIEKALQAIEDSGHLDSYSDEPGLIRGWDSLQTIKDCNADTIVEVSYTNVKTGQPAILHCEVAFNNGKNVVMTNKGPVALAYQKLSQLAKSNQVQWGFEGTVMSGTPTLRLPDVGLKGNKISEIRGILNGTTNYILTQMESEQISYESALKEAQNLGYAEADPSSDVEGLDARYKAVILANHLMGGELKVEEVECAGITSISSEMIEEAKKEGKRWKLLANVREEAGLILAKVGPEKLSITDPLAGVSGATNAVTFECDLLGPVTIMGAGAGQTETACSLLIDLIHMSKAQ
ncbi:homoserine dehydrogenase [Alkalihalobacillus trypoxylicola]|uniref:Homoserine dehydrogenase n=1 Tax=Alkalihalobacillus trypoxylicola TaxID=519424 RepID=A0A162DEW2_9BACI|nr:homoserine dehydrogenase [Alkalihalobacillus trypoxylicola]KYG29420.1 homoserine dehydrogenase [Alkalihalobacillus trypoxylicola]